MSLVSDIRTTLSGIATKFADGTVEYRRLTSAPNATPRTYSAWTIITQARCVEFGESQVQNPDDGIWYREETAHLRIPYEASVDLSIRDQVRVNLAPSSAGASVNNKVFSIRNQESSAAGSVAQYALYRRAPMLGDPRQGGV